MFLSLFLSLSRISLSLCVSLSLTPPVSKHRFTAIFSIAMEHVNANQDVGKMHVSNYNCVLDFTKAEEKRDMKI